jgi:2'-5' RNA ligase
MSVFLALDLDEPVRREVMSLTAAARGSVTAKWLPAEKLHLTLVFLGNPDVERVKSTLLAAAAQAPVRLALRGAGTFVTARAPSVLWLGVDGERARLDALQAWARALLGVEERQPWRPHVTLARAHSGEGALDPLAADFTGFASSTFEASHLTLYESTHHRFHVLLRVALAAPRE